MPEVIEELDSEPAEKSLLSPQPPGNQSTPPPASTTTEPNTDMLVEEYRRVQEQRQYLERLGQVMHQEEQLRRQLTARGVSTAPQPHSPEPDPEPQEPQELPASVGRPLEENGGNNKKDGGKKRD